MLYYLTQQDGTKDVIRPYNWEADIEQINPDGHWIATREKYGKREHWYSAPIFLDSETSHVSEDDGWIHQWAAEWGGRYIIGRNAGELTQFCAHVSDWCARKGQTWKVMLYVHNLGYDMEYMRAFFPEQEPEFFAVKPHRILTAKWNHLEFRCSYLLTNKSLKKWAKDSKSKYQKLTGTYDYDRIITPEDDLTEQDWAYQLNDVASQSGAWYNDRAHDGYDVATVPLTSTGFVRADCRNAAFANHYWKKKLRAMQPDITIYNALEKAFAGGETHGNRFYKDKTVHGTIGHRDFVSSYPARQMINGFPMGAFIPERVTCMDDVKMLINSHCILMHLYLRNVELKDRSITAPYLSLSKLEFNGRCKEYLDNGRVIRLEGTVDLWVTEWDYLIIMRQYKFFDTGDKEEDKGGYHIDESYIAPKGQLPAWMRERIMHYFHNKTTLKHSDHTTYMESKAMLNGIYGMTAERFVRNELKYDAGEWKETPPDDETRAELYIKKIQNKNTFTLFAWGVWTTALARYALNRCMEMVGWENFLYADTDSIFYLTSPEVEQRLNEYNAEMRSRADEAGAFVDWEGRHNCLGEFTMEDDAPIKAFRFIHAKCYAIIDKNDKLQVTVAGVTKKQRSDEKKTNADELGCIDNLTPGFVFRECGGSRITYNNKPLHIININGVDICCGASAVISPTEYKVNDLNNLDSDDELMMEMLMPEYMSDLYGDYIGIK